MEGQIMTEARTTGRIIDPDSDEYWEHNEYQALKMSFQDCVWPRPDPEALERARADCARLKELELKFKR